MALYNTVVEFKNLMRTDIQTENRQTIQLQRPLLSPWIFGVSGPTRIQFSISFFSSFISMYSYLHLCVVSCIMFFQGSKWELPWSELHSSPHSGQNLYLSHLKGRETGGSVRISGLANTLYYI